MSETAEILCPYAGKIVYATKTQAKRAIKRYRFSPRSRCTNPEPYYCVKGDHWHLTSKQLKK